MFNQPNFLGIRQLDLENKLILPTQKLYDQVGFQVNTLYQEIRRLLVDTHSAIATAGKQVYKHPVETLTAWYDQAVYSSATLYAELQAKILPTYQDWQAKVNVNKEKTGQYLQAFWDNPEQVAMTTFEPMTRYVDAVTGQSEHYWQLFMANPEQFMVAAIAPIKLYLTTLSNNTEAALISNYHTLANVFSLLMAQPSATLQALYRNTLSALLEVYFDVISSLLVMV